MNICEDVTLALIDWKFQAKRISPEASWAKNL